MAIWADTKRSETAALYRRAALAAHEFIAFAEAVAAGRDSADLRRLLASYVEGVCSWEDHLHHQIRKIINDVGVRHGYLPPGSTFFDDAYGVRRDILAFLCPDLVPALYTARDNAGLEIIPLLAATPNELADDTLPQPMNMLLHRPMRPAVQAYATDDASLYAHPFQYQVFSQDQSAMWVSGSPRALSRLAIGRPEVVTTDRDVVVLQDRFNCTNFAHFLYDSISRALLLNRQTQRLHSALLVFGGVPGQFHRLVCQTLAAVLGLPDESIYFPDRAVCIKTSGRCIWFSDQREAYLHPAQMAHPRSIEMLRSLAAATPGIKTGLDRIYVSRADAERRRIANEDRITETLARHGFATVQLAGLSMQQQIGLFRHAEMIVAPHGMGLTHLIFADRLRSLVELFPPDAGTDAYAFVAKALGIRYEHVVGTAVNSPQSDFAIDPNTLMSR